MRRSLFDREGTCISLPGSVLITSWPCGLLDGMYRTTPLKGVWSHQKGGVFHDGRFATLLDVVNHYNNFFGLGLSEREKNDVVEYLKSL